MKTSEIIQYFEYKHLPEFLQEASKPFCDLAKEIDKEHWSNQEKEVALRKLLEAKDACVRSLLYTSKNRNTIAKK